MISDYLDKYFNLIPLEQNNQNHMKLKVLFSAGLILTIFLTAKSQNVGVGADIMYNFQTESFGAGARVSIFPNNNLSIVPQFSYYPGFNKIHEYYLGLGLEYKFVRLRTFDFYLIGHGAFNSWINYASSSLEGAK